MSLMFGWNPWNLAGGIGTFGWNPWGFASQGVPTASLVRAIADAQATTAPSRQPGTYEESKFDDPENYRDTAFEFRMSMLAVEFLSAIEMTFDGATRTARVSVRSDGKLIIALTAPTADDINKGGHGLASTRDKHPADSAAVDALVAQNENIDAFMLRCAGALPEKDGGRYELARAVSILVNLVCLRMKHAFAVKRPHQLDANIVPMLPVPGHASYPGGHATMASALAFVITATVKGVVLDKMVTLAEQIAANRVRAGLHYQLDSVAGRQLGEALATHIITMLLHDQGAGSLRPTLPLLGVVWRKALEERDEE